MKHNQNLENYALVIFDEEENTFTTEFFGKFETAKKYKHEAETVEGTRAVIYKKMESENE